MAYHGYRFPRPGSGLTQIGQLRSGCFPVRGRGLVRTGVCPRHYQGKLAPGGLEVGQGLRQAASPHHFMPLGQLPAHGSPAVAQGCRQILQGGPQPVGRLEDDQRKGQGGHAGQQLAPGPTLARQKAQEQEAIGRQAGDGQGRSYCRRAGDRLHREPGGGHPVGYRRSGVADCRHTGIGNQRHVARLQRLQQFRQAGLPVMGVAADYRNPACQVI